MNRSNNKYQQKSKRSTKIIFHITFTTGIMSKLKEKGNEENREVLNQNSPDKLPYNTALRRG